MSFYFDTSDDEATGTAVTKLVIKWNAHSNEPRPGKIEHKGNTQLMPWGQVESVGSVRLTRRERPTHYAIRDHDFRRPSPDNPGLIYKAVQGAEAYEQYHF